MFKILLNLNLSFFKPSKTKILICDPTNSFYLGSILSNYNYSFLKARYEEINLYILFLTLGNIRNHRGLTFFQKYLLNYIDHVKPKIIISCTSHNIFFLRLKNFFPEVKLVIIQHASLSTNTLKDILLIKSKNKISEKFLIDYLCVFGSNSENFYSKIINAKKTLITGSIKNNHFEQKNSRNDAIIFISQFRIKNNKVRQILTKPYEKFFYENLSKYCMENKKKLFILSSNVAHLRREKKFYDEVIGEKKYIFLPKLNWSSSYKSSLNFKYFITHSSTLGYELIARGKRVAFVHQYHKSVKKMKNYTQAFYAKKFSGNFWTNSNNSKKFKKILDYTFNRTTQQFIKDRKNFIDPLVIYNKNNTSFKNLIKKIY